jgi:hypothetical protein
VYRHEGFLYSDTLFSDWYEKDAWVEYVYVSDLNLKKKNQKGNEEHLQRLKELENTDEITTLPCKIISENKWNTS